MIKPIYNTIHSFANDLFEKNNHTARKHILTTLKARKNAERTTTENLADYLTSSFGSVAFLSFNILFFISWIYINSATRHAFDPFPYTLLTTIVSLEAIILSIFVLMSQTRASKVDDIREEIHLQINMIAEKEITKTLQILKLIAEKHNIDLSKDKDLTHYLTPIKESTIEKIVEKEIN